MSKKAIYKITSVVLLTGIVGFLAVESNAYIKPECECPGSCYGSCPGWTIWCDPGPITSSMRGGHGGDGYWWTGSSPLKCGVCLKITTPTGRLCGQNYVYLEWDYCSRE